MRPNEDQENSSYTGSFSSVAPSSLPTSFFDEKGVAEHCPIIAVQPYDRAHHFQRVLAATSSAWLTESLYVIFFFGALRLIVHTDGSDFFTQIYNTFYFKYLFTPKDYGPVKGEVPRSLIWGLFDLLLFLSPAAKAVNESILVSPCVAYSARFSL